MSRIFEQEIERGFEGAEDPEAEILEVEVVTVPRYVLPFHQFSDHRRLSIVTDSKGWGLAYSEDASLGEIYLTGDLPLPWWLEPYLIRTDQVQIP